MPRRTSQHVALAPARANATIVSAIIVPTQLNSPEIPIGSVAFLQEPGFTGEGWYAIGHDGQQPADIRIICRTSGGYTAKLLGWEDAGQELSRADLERIKPYRVAGVAKPFMPSFERFLRERFAICGRAEP